MKLLSETKQYREIFSFWAGCKISLDDDFELFCQDDFDFIEILMLFENEFFLNLLDSSKTRQDFEKIGQFFSWVVSQPAIEQSFIFSYYQVPDVLNFPEDNYYRKSIDHNSCQV